MQLFKITCAKCRSYDSCSQKTRMFVNYCGSRFQNVEKHIRCAISECRSKHGYMLQSVIFPSAVPHKFSVENLKVAHVPV
jgi:hypothetical protein